MLVTISKATNDNCRQAVDAIERAIAMEDYRKVKTLLSQWPKTDCKVLQDLYFAEVYLYEGDPETAEQLLQILLNQKLDILHFYKTQYLLALAHIDQAEDSMAVAYLDNILEAKPSSYVYQEALDLRINLHSKQSEHLQAMQLLKTAFADAEQQSDLKNQSLWLNQIATNYYSQGQTDSAIHYFHSLIKLKQKQEDTYGLLSDYSTLGGLYQKLGNYQAAQQQLMFATKIAEEERDTFSLIATYIDIANNYLEQRLLVPAFTHAQQAEVLSKQKSMLLNEGNSLMIQARVYELNSEMYRASEIYKNALAIFEQLGLKQQSADAQIKIADIDNSLQSLNNAVQKLEDLLQVQMADENKLGELDTHIALARILFRLGKNKTAILQELDKGVDLARITNNRNALKDIYEIRAYVLEQEGDYKAALNNYRAFEGIKDTLLNQENAKMIRELETQYETEKKDKEILENKAELERRQNRITQMLLGILAMSMLIAFGIFAYFRNQQLAKQRSAVITKERETEVLRAMVMGEERERQRIAKDLHDSLGTIMASAKMRVSALQYKLPKLKELESFQKAEELIDDACNTVREVSHNMMPKSLSKYGLERAIEEVCFTISEANPDMKVDFITYGLDELEDDFLQINIYRIVQELLKNVVKHAAALELLVQLTLEDKILNITVEDNGKGFDNAIIEEGIGLGSIRSRVLGLKGKLTLDTVIGRGTTFMIDVPIKDEKHD